MLYKASGLLGLLSSVFGALLLSLDSSLLVYSYYLWWLGVVSFAIHFALIKSFFAIFLNLFYHIINSFGIMRLVNEDVFLIYLISGFILICLAFYMHQKSKLKHNEAEIDPLVKKMEIVGVVFGLLASLLLALQFNPVISFLLWMISGLCFIGMSLKIKANYVLMTQYIYLITQLIGVYNGTTLTNFYITSVIYSLILFSIYYSCGSKLRINLV